MKEIELTQGYKAIIDDENFELINKYNWCLSKKKDKYYAVFYRDRKPIYMHRFILNISNTDIIIDHKNNNGLDNRKENLRIADKSKNAINSKKRSGCSSKFKGVSFNKAKNCWEAYINKNNQRVRLGYFNEEEKAALAYNKMAKLLHKDFATPNEV